MIRNSILFTLLFALALPLAAQYSQEELDTYFSYFRKNDPPSFPQGWGDSPNFDSDYFPARDAFWRSEDDPCRQVRPTGHVGYETDGYLVVWMDFCKENENPRLVYLTSYGPKGEKRDELILSGIHDDTYYSADILRERTIILEREIFRMDEETFEVLEERRYQDTYLFTDQGTFELLYHKELELDD